METLLKDLTAYTIFGNSILRITISAVCILAGIAVVANLRRYIVRKYTVLQDNNSPTIIHTLFRIRNVAAPMIYIIIIYLSLVTLLSFSAENRRTIHVVFMITVSFFGLRLAAQVIRDSLKIFIKKKDGKKSDEQIEQTAGGIASIINIIVWIIGVIFVIENIGFNISAILTGIGIGGVAVAFASQTIFRDLFNYFVINFDQPFKIGDFIVIDDKMGTVVSIGIKTTRIKSLGGEEIILSNTDLTSSRVHNYKKMERRRVVLTISVIYQTPPDQVDTITAIIKEIIDATDMVSFDRAHFKEFGDSGLIFETVYYVESPDYNDYMDRQHEINLAILSKLNHLKVEFAYPTRTLYIEKG